MGIRTERYKLIYFYGEPLGKSGAMNKPTKPFWEFYDLEKDPNENRNEIYNSDYSELIVEMKSRLLKLKDEVGDSETKISLME